MNWHSLSPFAAAQTLEVDPEQGLSAEEATRRLEKFGPNQLTEPPGKPLWQRFLAQLLQPLVAVLVIAGLVTAYLGEWVDAGVILAVVLVNAAVGTWQEARAEGALAALARSLTATAVVRRSGHRENLDATRLVPGDVVLLTAGDRIPADLRLIHAGELQANEAMLTGESLPVAKQVHALSADLPLADRVNLAFAGSTLVSGQGIGLVVATGDQTETGRIARLIATTPSLATPLTRRMAQLSGQLLWIISALAALAFAVGLARGEGAFDMFMAAVALAVGAIPEGLPAAVTVTLAIGVGRMARRRAIVRHLPAVEALGSATVICADKTGTLTENAMTVRALWCAGSDFSLTGQGYDPTGAITGPEEKREQMVECLAAAALCNDASLFEQNGRWQITGDPTEAALLVAARKAGLDLAQLRKSQVRQGEWPFAAEHQWMATLHQTAGGQPAAYLKGAPERLLPACRGLNQSSAEVAARQMAEGGLRVLAICRYRDALPDTLSTLADGPLELLGLVGMIDPPRPQAIAAVAACRAAGIGVKMITGDHAVTAQAIARQLGLDASRCLTGRELANLDDAALQTVVSHTDIFARIDPTQKLRLVRALQSRGEIVAMTGDGVNDAPALRQADIGIAMGQGGTEVAREAAAMVLTDDNFATIEAAVEEGRGVWDNLVKYMTWTLPTNFGEGLVILAAILLGTTLPITPLQILWINMTTAGLLGLTLAAEPLRHGLMSRAPRRPTAPILGPHLLRRVVLVSLLLLAGAFGLFLRELNLGHDLAEARTVAVNVFVLVECFFLFQCRSLDGSPTGHGWFANLWLWGGVIAMLASQLLLTYWPPLNRAFQTAPLSREQWLAIVCVALIAATLVEADKYCQRRFT